MYQQIHLFS